MRSLGRLNPLICSGYYRPQERKDLRDQQTSPQSAESKEVQRWGNRLSKITPQLALQVGPEPRVTWFPELYTVDYPEPGRKDLREYLVHPSHFMKFI